MPQMETIVVSTIDANLQSIVESKIAEFNDAMKDSSHEGAKILV